MKADLENLARKIVQDALGKVSSSYIIDEYPNEALLFDEDDRLIEENLSAVKDIINSTELIFPEEEI